MAWHPYGQHLPPISDRHWMDPRPGGRPKAAEPSSPPHRMTSSVGQQSPLLERRLEAGDRSRDGSSLLDLIPVEGQTEPLPPGPLPPPQRQFRVTKKKNGSANRADPFHSSWYPRVCLGYRLFPKSRPVVRSVPTCACISFLTTLLHLPTRRRRSRCDLRTSLPV